MRKEGPKHTDLYWDCECPEHYIHCKLEDKCFKCNAVREDQPDSIASEVVDMFSHKRSGGPDKRGNNGN